MGFLDDAKNKLGDLGHKAGEAFEAAKDKASDVVDDVKERLDVNDDGQVTVSEAFEAVKDKVTGNDAAADSGDGVAAAPTGTSPDVAPVDTPLDQAGDSATPSGEAVTPPATPPVTSPVEPAADPLHPMDAPADDVVGNEGGVKY